MAALERVIYHINNACRHGPHVSVDELTKRY